MCPVRSGSDYALEYRRGPGLAFGVRGDDPPHAADPDLDHPHPRARGRDLRRQLALPAAAAPAAAPPLPRPLLASRDPLRVPAAGGLDRPTLGGEVDVDDAEAHRVPARPLEVVEERPDEVGVGESLRAVDVVAEVLDASRVVDPVERH